MSASATADIGSLMHNNSNSTFYRVADRNCLYRRTCAAASVAWVNPTNATKAPTT